MAEEVDALGDELVNVGRLHLLRLVGPVEADIRPSQVVLQDAAAVRGGRRQREGTKGDTKPRATVRRLTPAPEQ